MEILPERSRAFTTGAGAALAAVIVACGALWPVVFADAVPAYGDNISFWAPNTHFWLAEMKRGCFPLWNPQVLGGVPFAADINHGIFYPPNWIVLLTGAAKGLRLLVVLHAALGIFGVYLFAKSLGMEPLAALFAGAAFGVSQSFLPLSNHVVMLESMSYAGYALFLAGRLAERGGVRTALALALVVALSLVAGDVHATYIISLAAAAVFVVGVCGTLWGGRIFEAGRATVFGLGAGAAAGLLAAVAILPAIELTKASLRAGGESAYATAHALDGRAAIAAVLPNVWGRVSDGTVWNYRAGNGVYVGAVVLALAVYGARRVRRAAVGLMLVLVGISLSLGEKSVLWELARRFLPAFRLFRQPREYFIIAAVGVIILAAWGLSDILKSKGAARRSATGWGKWAIVMLLLCGASLAVFAAAGGVGGAFSGAFAARYGANGPGIAKLVVASFGQAGVPLTLAGAAVSAWHAGWRLGPRAVGAIVAALAVIDYGIVSSGGIVFGPKTLCEGRTAIAESITGSGEAKDVRIAVEAGGFGEYFDKYRQRAFSGEMAGEAKTFETLARVKECMVDDEPLYAGLRSALGYSTFLPLRYAALYRIAAGGNRESPVRLRGESGTDWRLVGAGSVIAASNDWRNISVRAVDGADEVRMLYDWTAASSLEEAVGCLGADRERALSAPVIEGVPGWAEKSDLAEIRHSVEKVWRGMDVMTLRVFTDEPGFLFVAESNYPGWKAYDNGAQTPIYTANVAYMAVYLTAGRHDVELRFRPATFYWGLAITVGALLGFLGAFLATARRGDEDEHA